jgi:hypothetical protein
VISPSPWKGSEKRSSPNLDPLPKISTEKDLKEKEIVEKIEDDDESDTK